jgi:signal transduction histidine kinase/ActR/RegA family two-component response regulator
MKTISAAVAAAFLIVLLSWLLLHSFNSDTELFEEALGELARMEVTQASLHDDVLTARIGLLRNYDPLVEGDNALMNSLARLRHIIGGDATASLDRLDASLQQQETLVEQFKSDNALLQNSLAYFTRLSSRQNAPQGGLVIPGVSALAAAMLHLTVDSSPETADEVQARLNELADRPTTPETAETVAALLANGRLLHAILPATDGILRGFCSVATKPNLDALRQVVLTQQSASRATARQFRLGLYIVSLLLLAVLAYVGFELRTRGRALRRRAAFEHAIASISTRLITAQPQDVDAHIDAALAFMGECVGADRVYFIKTLQPQSIHRWKRRGVIFPPDWPEAALALAAKFEHSADGIVHVPDVNRLPSGEHRTALIMRGLRGWAFVSRAAGNGSTAILGFDALRRPCRITAAGELGLLRMALDAITNAVERTFLDRERGRLEARLHQAHRLETVGALTSGIAHNFNNLVGTILGHTEMAESRPVIDASVARSLGEIRRAGERGRDLIDHLLAFGRPRSEHHQAIELVPFIAEVKSQLDALLPGSIAVILEETGETAIISADVAQLQQVVVNLCKNAARAMGDAGQITIETEVHELAVPLTLSHGDLPCGRYVSIAVSDSGHGMDNATVMKIFEPFFTTRADGNGLGLATARDVVREHSGAMNVTSAQGRGSRFEVWLPTIAPDEQTSSEKNNALRRGRGEAILIIEHDREQLLHDEEMLAGLGYEAVGFAQPEDALEACWTAPDRFDAAIISRLNSAAVALELATALHEMLPRLPILLGTGAGDGTEARALVSAGVAEILRRPLVTSEVAAALAHSLSGNDDDIAAALSPKSTSAVGYL